MSRQTLRAAFEHKFLPSRLAHGDPWDSERRLAILTLRFGALAFVLIGLAVIPHVLRGRWVNAGATAVMSMAGAVAPFIVRAGYPRMAMHVLLSVIFLGMCAVVVRTGGLGLPMLFSFGAFAHGAVLLGGKRVGACWTVVCTVGLGALATAHARGVSFPDAIAPHLSLDQQIAGAAVLLWITFAISLLFERQREQALEAFRRSTARFQQISDNIAEIFLLANASLTKLEYANPAFSTIMGRSAEPFYADASGLFDNVVAEDRQELDKRLATVADGQSVELEFRFEPESGVTRWLGGEAFPVRDEDERVHGIAVILRDVTSRMNAQAESLERLDILEALTGAAAAIEDDSFDPADLASVADRKDPLGGLATILIRMAMEITARQERAKRQLRALRGGEEPGEELPGRVLVVDDTAQNRELLARMLGRRGHSVDEAESGMRALEILAADGDYDLVLLDVMMPGMDGREVLQRLKSSAELKHIPVLMVSAMSDVEMVGACIEIGADDYLVKPVDRILLFARVRSSLRNKRHHDRQAEYLRQVQVITDAAAAIESRGFDAGALGSVAERSDALGKLGRVFRQMAKKVHEREQRLERQIEQLRLDVLEHNQAARATAAAYIPVDRRLAMAAGNELPRHTAGAALLADITGFTPLAEGLAEALGPDRGAEELVRHLNRAYTALIGQVHAYGGSVIGFSGDAITCWFDAHQPEAAPEPARRALTCSFAMQRAIEAFRVIDVGSDERVSIRIKVAVASGDVSRFVVGEPGVQHIDVLVGSVLDMLERGEKLALAGETVATKALVNALGGVKHGPVRDDASGTWRLCTKLDQPAAESPWPAAGDPSAEQARPWLLPAVYEQLSSGRGAQLAEHRVATALFVGFDLDADDALDGFVRWVNEVLGKHGGHILQVTIGEKGNFLYAVFGAPKSDERDAVHAVDAAHELSQPPTAIAVSSLRMGIARGAMRVGSYGAVARCTYGVLGDKTNVAARLMQASDGEILCDDEVRQAAGRRWHFEELAPVTLKGKGEPVPVFRPDHVDSAGATEQRWRELSPSAQELLKGASVIGREFELDILGAILPSSPSAEELRADVETLAQSGELSKISADSERYRFEDDDLRELGYSLMLFSQRRQLHRAVAELYERSPRSPELTHLKVLAHHWEQAESLHMASQCYEKAAVAAREAGKPEYALELVEKACVLAEQAPASSLAPTRPS